MANFNNTDKLAFMEYIEKNIGEDGNCFYRCLSYYYRKSENDHLEFRNILYYWLKNNKELFIDYILEDTNPNNTLSREERLQILIEKIEKVKIPGYWAGDLELSGISIMLNININLYIKTAYFYQRYFKFETGNPTETIYILYVN